MKTIRVLHPCRPAYDNLGEIAANEAIAPMFRRRGIDVELVEVDVWEGRAEGSLLDDRMEQINADYDLVMIGPAGFLGPKLIDSIFESSASWSRLTTPLCFNGVGIVASVTRPVWYGGMDSQSHVMQALRHAAVVSTRELNSWLLASRALGGDSERLILAGCPSIRLARCTAKPVLAYDLALNLSFTHEVCRAYVPLLMQVATAVRAQRRRVLWICHSRLDEIQAEGVNRQLGLGFDIVRPLTASEAGAAYAACEHALVTRFHAGVFCLANAVPFGFLGYDMKCWNLMSMFADEAYQYVLPIDRLTSEGVADEVDRLLQRLSAATQLLQKAESLLVEHFDQQTDRFVDQVLASTTVFKHMPDEVAG
jgi:hypothetical protein